MFRRDLLFLPVILLGSGCSILPERTPIKYFTFEVNPPEGLTIRPLVKTTIQIYQPSIADAFSGLNFYIQGEDGQFFKTAASRLLAPSNDIIGNIARNWFQKTGPWSTVLAPNSEVSGNFGMNIMIRKLYVKKSQNSGTVYCSMDFQVSNQNTQKLVLSHSVDASVYVPTFEGSKILEGYNEAIKSCLLQFSQYLQNRRI